MSNCLNKSISQFLSIYLSIYLQENDRGAIIIVKGNGNSDVYSKE